MYQTAMVHLLRNSFPGLVLVMLCLEAQVSGEIRENWFKKFHLCSDTIPNTESVPARSKLTCAALCSVRSTCTACSYLPNGTCNLHYGDLTSSTCPAAVTSAAHFQKVKKELGHFFFWCPNLLPHFVSAVVHLWTFHLLFGLLEVTLCGLNLLDVIIMTINIINFI